MRHLTYIQTITLTFILTATTLLPADAQTNIRRVVVSPTGTTQDGLSWAEAMTLQAALTASGADDQIWIAAGIYKPGTILDADAPTNAERAATFTIPTGVKLYGGFAGNEAADFNPATTPLRGGGVTILSGDLLGGDGTRPVQPAPPADAMNPTTEETNVATAYTTALAAYNASRTDNSYTVVTVEGGNATLDGLTITAGEGGTPFLNFGVVAERLGAGLFAPVGTAGLKLINCIFSGNNITSTGGADFLGGAAYFLHEATVSGCTFIDNMAGSGGAVYVDGTQADVKFKNCTFMDNTANIGGAVHEKSSDGGTFESCLFANNKATAANGGALRSEGISLITNTVFYNNTANTQGGGVYFPNGSTVINCTFYNNRTNTRGGGIFLETDAIPATLRNNLLIGNTATNDASGHQVYVDNIDAAHVFNLQNNLIAGGATGATAGIRYATAGALDLREAGTVNASNVAAVFASIMEAEENFLRLAVGSPAINAGNNDYLNNGTPANTNDDITTDLAGRPRILDGRVDIGAYESGLQPQTIMFTPTDAGAAGTEIVLEATASSGLLVTFMITGGTGTATIADGTNTLRLTGIGTVEITATQAGNDDYAATTETQIITVSQGTQDITFTSDGAGTAGTDIDLVATASSGLDVTFMITGEFETDGTTPATAGSVATLADDGTTLSLIGVGTVEITATQAGNTSYTAATETQTITVSQGTQTIAFTSDDEGTAGTDITLEATGGASGLPVTFAINEEFETDGTTPATDGTVATLADDGTTLSLIGVGKVEITATQAGNTSYAMATKMQTITVSQGTQVIAFTSDDAGDVGTDIDLVATASSGLDVTFMITGEFEMDGTTPATAGSVATLSGSTTLSLIGVGTVEITATQAGNTNYATATKMQIITVSQGTQTIAFTSDDAGNVGTDISLVATASSTLPVTFMITGEFETDGTTPATDGTVATLSGGNNLTLVGVGTVEITATQAGNTNYATATKMQIITVSQGTQTIAFTSDDAGAAGTDITLEATGGASGLPVTFMITGEFEMDGTTPATDGTVATLSGGTTLSLIGVGKVEITATQAGNDDYAATTETQTITVSQGTQTIAFTSDGVGTINTEIELTATASSGLAVTFAVTNQSPTSGSGDVATLADNGTTLSLTGAGTAIITATQAGNANYATATQEQTITVSAIPLISQTITFTSGDTGTVGTPITLAATTTSTGTVTFAVTEVQDADGNVVVGAAADAVATLASSTLTLLAVGTVTITASQAGGDIGGTIYAAATQTQVITIMPMVVVPPATQTIAFASPTEGSAGSTITLVATATSTGTVTFAVTEVQDADGNVVTNAAADAVATLSGSTLTLRAAGTVTITASQAGGDIGGTIYATATETQEITITSVVLGLEDAVADGFVLYPNPTSGKLHFSEQVAEFRLYGIEGRLLETRKNVRSADLSARPAGLYFVEVVRDGRSLRWRVVRE